MIEITIGARPDQSSTTKTRIIVLTNLSTSTLGVNTYHELRFGLDDSFSSELEFYAYEDIRFPEMRMILIKANVDNQSFTLYVDQATTTHTNPTFANFVNGSSDFTLLGYDYTENFYDIYPPDTVLANGGLTGVYNSVNWELPIRVTGDRKYYRSTNNSACQETSFPVNLPEGISYFSPLPCVTPTGNNTCCNDGSNIFFEDIPYKIHGLIKNNDNDTITNSLIQLGDNTVRDVDSYVKYDLIFTGKRGNINPNERLSIAHSGATPNINLTYRARAIFVLNDTISNYVDQIGELFSPNYITGVNGINDSNNNVFGMNIIRTYNEESSSPYYSIYTLPLRENINAGYPNEHSESGFNGNLVNNGNMRSTALFVEQDSTNGTNSYYGGFYSSVIIDKDVVIDEFITTFEYNDIVADMIAQYEADLESYYDLWNCAKTTVEAYNIQANKYVTGTICLNDDGVPITGCVCKEQYTEALDTITDTTGCVYNLIVAYGNLLNDYQAIISLGVSVEPPVNYTNPDWNDYNKYVHYGMPDMPNDMHIGIVYSDVNEPDYVVNTLPTNPVNWLYYFVANSDGTVSVQEYNGTNWNILDTTTIPNMSIVFSGSEQKYYCYYNGEFITNVPWFSRDPYDYVTTVSTVGGAYGQTVGVNKNNSPNRRTVTINGHEYIIWTDINNDVWLQYDDTDGTKTFRLQDDIDIIGEDL